MRDSKVVGSLKDAILAAGLKDGMRISFHHNLRNGDQVFNQVIEAIRSLGIKDLTFHSSGVFDCWNIVEAVEDGTITGYESTGLGNKRLAKMVSEGKAFKKPILLDSHGGRASMVETGRIKIDIAFVGAASCDCMGNMTGKTGPSAFGSMAYSMVDTKYADKVIAVTDNLVPYPLFDFSIPETLVDYVVQVDSIGDPAGIASGVAVMTTDPERLKISQNVAKVIQYSGAMDMPVFGYQAGAGGIAMAVSAYLADVMKSSGRVGDYLMGLTTKQQVDLYKAGLFRCIIDPQTADLDGVASCGTPGHVEVSTSHYASPTAKSCMVDKLSVAVLGATEVDVDFNCNCLTGSHGAIVGGIGGHSDVAEGCNIAIIALPMLRKTTPCIVEKVATVVTPGKDIDVVVTEAGISVNPARQDIISNLEAAGLPLVDIHDLPDIIKSKGGIYKTYERSDEVVADVWHRGQYIIDHVTKTP